jgi:hypothetical protein
LSQTPDDSRLGHGNGLAIREQATAAGGALLSREQDRWPQLAYAIGRIMNPAAGKE